MKVAQQSHGIESDIDRPHVPGEWWEVLGIGEFPQGLVELPRPGRYNVEMKFDPGSRIPIPIHFRHPVDRTELVDESIEFRDSTIKDVGILDGIIHIGDDDDRFGRHDSGGPRHNVSSCRRGNGLK